MPILDEAAFTKLLDTGDIADPVQSFERRPNVADLEDERAASEQLGRSEHQITTNDQV